MPEVRGKAFLGEYMKTLDEVIEACKYQSVISGTTLEDTLYYLIEYRNMIENLTKAIVDAYEYIKPLIGEEQ